MSQAASTEHEDWTSPWTLDDRWRALPQGLVAEQGPEKVGVEPRLIHGNHKLAAELGLTDEAFDDPAFIAVMAGHAGIAGAAPLSTVYSGHQFGHYVPQLGDGRAVTIAQWRQDDVPRELQLKGAGRTPFSRFGDGRAVMRSTLREYLCSEAMAALGIPTTRALCVVATHEGVQRETVEPGAVLARLAPSHVRFGHFEYLHHTEQPELLQALADQVIDFHFPQFAAEADRYLLWFREVVRRTAVLMAKWQAVGFTHSVMNTDNMSVLGLTIDYGPYGFLDAYNPGFTPNHTDQAGRYAYDQQPTVGLWNLQALAVALTSLVEVEQLQEALEGYAGIFEAAMRDEYGYKFGLDDHRDGDEKLMGTFLALMKKAGADYSLAFRSLSDALESDVGVIADQFQGEYKTDVRDWWTVYEERVAELDKHELAQRLRHANPKFVLRNWVAETAIRAVEDEGDLNTLDDIFRVVTTPFDEHAEFEKYATAPPAEMQTLSLSCSS